MKMRTIRFGDVTFDRKARERIDNIIKGRNNTEGYYVEKFEHGFAARFGFPHAIMTSSGTTAGEVLWMAICEKYQIRWGRHRKVITPALAFVATANCIVRRSGLEPRFVDIRADLNMADEGLGCTFPIGVQFVLNMGRSTRLDSVAKIAHTYDWFFAVDACEAHGAMLHGREISAYCDAAIYSFYPAHIMTVGGEGGMICTHNRELADLCRSIKSHGRPVGKIDHEFQRIGTNAKSTEFAAAVGISALENFDENFRRRREVRAGLLERLDEFPLTLYPDAPGEVIAPHAFPLLTEDLARLKSHLSEWQIEHKPLWGALSNHDAYAWLGTPRGYFPNAEYVGARGLHFGCHELLTDDDLDYIYDVFKMFFGIYPEAA